MRKLQLTKKRNFACSYFGRSFEGEVLSLEKSRTFLLGLDFCYAKKAVMTTVSEGKEDKKVTKSTKQIQAIVQGTCTFNNTHVIVRDFKGNVIFKASGGLLGKSLGSTSLGGGKKSSAFAALYLAEEVAKNILEKGITRVELVLKGFGKGRSYIHRGLRNGGLQVLSIKQATNLPHNGCRPRKSRRL